MMIDGGTNRVCLLYFQNIIVMKLLISFQQVSFTALYLLLAFHTIDLDKYIFLDTILDTSINT